MLVVKSFFAKNYVSCEIYKSILKFKMTTCGFEGHNSSTNKHVKLSLFISKLHLFQYFIIVRLVVHATMTDYSKAKPNKKKNRKNVW